MTDPHRPGPDGSGMAVDAAALARRGAEVAESALGASGTALAAAAWALADALPGSRSAVAARALAERWDRAYALWVADAAAHGEAMAAAADDYAGTDSAAAGGLRGLSDGVR